MNRFHSFFGFELVVALASSMKTLANCPRASMGSSPRFLWREQRKVLTPCPQCHFLGIVIPSMITKKYTRRTRSQDWRKRTP